MTSKTKEAAIDQIVASCNGDIRGALKALLLVNRAWRPNFSNLCDGGHGVRAIAFCTRLWSAARRSAFLTDRPVVERCELGVVEGILVSVFETGYHRSQRMRVTLRHLLPA